MPNDIIIQTMYPLEVESLFLALGGTHTQYEVWKHLRQAAMILPPHPFYAELEKHIYNAMLTDNVIAQVNRLLLVRGAPEVVQCLKIGTDQYRIFENYPGSLAFTVPYHFPWTKDIKGFFEDWLTTQYQIYFELSGAYMTDS